MGLSPLILPKNLDTVGYDRLNMVRTRLRTRCPETGQTLIPRTLIDAERLAGKLQAREGTPFGTTEQVLLREDNEVAYPIVGDTPILLVPEALTSEPRKYDLTDSRWSEAYEEMEYYNETAAQMADTIPNSLIDQLTGHIQTAFPSPDWLDAPYDAAAQLDGYMYIGDVTDQLIAQLGGKGLHAVKLLLAGAREAWLVTPMYEEILYGYELSRRIGVSDRFNAVVAIAEQMPFDDAAFDAVYAGGCLHHMETEHAGPEVSRVLAQGGRFVAIEPWQTSLHRIGTRLIGKRESNPYCRPLNAERLAPLKQAFDHLEVRHHGPVLRYLALGLMKVTTLKLSPKAGLRMTRVDDVLPLREQMGGSLAVLASRH